MPLPEVSTEFYPCAKCGGRSIFKICPCYFKPSELLSIELLETFPDQRLTFETVMAWWLLQRQDERAFTMALHHFFNHYFGYHYYMADRVTIAILQQQIHYLERVCLFLKQHEEEIFQGRSERVRVHNLVDPIRQVNQMIATATLQLALLKQVSST